MGGLVLLAGDERMIYDKNSLHKKNLEFNLSEKAIILSKEWGYENPDLEIYLRCDVKEFIKLWIGSLIPDDKPIDCINKLKKLAGEKLI